MSDSDPARPQSRYEASVAYPAEATFDRKGWRSFFAYRDLGVKAATGEDYDFRVVRSRGGDPVPTGWHYHVLELQVVYCLGGWEAIALEDGRVAKLVPGACLNIPPGFCHNEIGYAPDMEMLVVTKPAAAATVAVDAPDGWDDDAMIGRVATEMAPERMLDPWNWRSPASAQSA